MTVEGGMPVGLTVSGGTDKGRGRRGTRSVLSYWRDYFDPDSRAPRANYSTGWIASRLHELLRERGPVAYRDSAQECVGMSADLFVGHFWSFAPMCAKNRFARRIAVYVLSDPDRARARLLDAAERHGVPFPDWDLPPADFDHTATMELADAVLLVGNSTTLATFDPRWHSKIRLVNYAVDQPVWSRPLAVERRPEFVYAATTCGLRKGRRRTTAGWRPRVPPASKVTAGSHPTAMSTCVC